MSDLIDARFDLRRMYGVTDRDEARRKLGEHTAVLIKDEGVIILSVADRDRERAIAIAEEYLAQIDTILLDLISRAQAVIPERRGRAAGARDRGRRFAHGKLSRPVRPVRDGTTGAGNARHCIQSEQPPQHARCREAAARADDAAGKRQSRQGRVRMEAIARPASSDAGNRRRAESFPPFKKLPEISTHYMQFMSERRMQEFMLAYLRLRLADAEITANTRMSVLKVLDPPSAPDRRSWPKRKQIVLVSTAATFFWASFAMVLFERRRASGGPAKRDADGGGAPGRRRRIGMRRRVKYEARALRKGDRSEAVHPCRRGAARMFRRCRRDVPPREHYAACPDASVRSSFIFLCFDRPAIIFFLAILILFSNLDVYAPFRLYRYLIVFLLASLAIAVANGRRIVTHHPHLIALAFAFAILTFQSLSVAREFDLAARTLDDFLRVLAAVAIVMQFTRDRREFRRFLLVLAGGFCSRTIFPSSCIRRIVSRVFQCSRTEVSCGTKDSSSSPTALRCSSSSSFRCWSSSSARAARRAAPAHSSRS